MSQSQTPAVWKISSRKACKTCSFDSANASMTLPLTFRYSPGASVSSRTAPVMWSIAVGVFEEASRTSKCPETCRNSWNESFEMVSGLCYFFTRLVGGESTNGRALFLRSKAPSLSGSITIHSCFTGVSTADTFRPLLRFEGYFNVRASCRYACRVERVNDISRKEGAAMIFES